MLKQQAILTGTLYLLMNVVLVICVTTEKNYMNMCYSTIQVYYL